jgi:hypothetical protein
VEDYHGQFLALLCHCEGLAAGHAMNLFTAGLGEPMTSDVEMQRPEDLQAAMSLARAFERRASVAAPTPVARYQSRSRVPGTGGSTVPTSATAGTASPALVASVAASSPAAMTHSRFHRLSPKEMADKRKKDKCYFCLEKFSLDHKCASKGVFLMELEETDDLEIIADEFGVSLHAMTGLCGATTMQLMVHIGSKQLCALVDSGSTHSFVHEAVVHVLGLDVTHWLSLSVKVANGERLQSYGVCKATMVHI